MVDPLSHLLVILLAWCLASFLKNRSNHIVLCLLGFMLLLAYSPLAAFFILVTCFESALLVWALQKLHKSNKWRKYLPYALLLNLFFVDFHIQIIGFEISILAISFSTVRIFMTTKQVLVDRKAAQNSDYWWIFVAAFYLPALFVGPVFSGLIIRDQQREKGLVEITLRDHRLLLQGVILSTTVSVFLSRLEGVISGGELLYGIPLNWAVPTIPVILFLHLFTSFWGQSLIAEHSSRFFGYNIPKNFDSPWKARSIRDFWSRWHRSMANFVIQYVYLPATIKGVSPKVATTIAFVFMGLWHNTSLGYFVWGLAHGLAMSYSSKIDGFGVGKLKVVSGIIITWTVVISLSYIANYSGIS